jgi:hypothetical protein
VRYNSQMPEDVPLTDDNSSLEQLRSRLYAQNAPAAFATPQVSQAPQAPVTQSTWTPPPPPKPKKPFSWTVLFLVIAAGFFIIAAGVSSFFLLHGFSTVSNNNILITVQGPTSLASGSVAPLVVTIQNKNPAAITGADIAMTFPDGTRSAGDLTQPLVRYANTIGTIPAGGSVSFTVQAVLFGSVNQSITIPATFQYHTANSNALFVKQQNYTFTITSSPLSITAQTTGNTASGQPFTINLAVSSNAATPLDNIAVSAQYPFGFTAQKVQVDKGSASSSLYVLGTLAPGEQRHITVTGTLTGSENDQRDFQFTVGTQKTDGTQGLSVAYASDTSTITITKPFLNVSLALNHADTDPAVVISGEPISGLMAWTNSLSTALANAQVTVKLSGNALDGSSVPTQNGFYDSSTNTISFTQQTVPGLAVLNPGDTGTGTFTLSTKTGAAFNALRNPIIQLSVSIAGLPNGGSQESITNTLTKTIQVATDLELASRIVHSTGPFPNTGPWPPVPNSPTTYTVLMSVTNTVNSIGGASATMILPSYVTFTGKVTPTDGSLTYDDSTRTVTWNIGDVAAGTGFGTQPTTAAFQISYTPSVSQSQTSPILVGNQTLTGTDRFTSAQVGNTAPALTTQAATDPAYKNAFGTVGN